MNMYQAENVTFPILQISKQEITRNVRDSRKSEIEKCPLC